jgi:hypothetical protein
LSSHVQCRRPGPKAGHDRAVPDSGRSG